MGAEVRGLREFRNELRAIDLEWPKKLRKVNKTVADKAAGWARDEARSGGGMQAAAAQSIIGVASQTSASIGVTAGKRTPYANFAFWGGLRHTGWYAKPRYKHSPAQVPPWVGDKWEAAVVGQGPYALNAALAKHLPDLLDEFGDAIEDLAAQAFPD